jgi:succinyl-CoA synthetase beta subunit
LPPGFRLPQRYLHWKFEAKKRFGLCIFDYMVTSNHVHLLVKDTAENVIALLTLTALEVVLSDPAVRSVLVNIFGGITRCDLVAQGILEALGRVEPKVPIVVRLDGTNAEEGRRLLTEADHDAITPAATMLEGAERAVAAARGER